MLNPNRTNILPFSASRLLALCLLFATPVWAWQSDRGDGTFANPPLYADYPDPDIIRVGDDFYFAHGFIMKDCGAVGRMTFLSPISWKDGWPVWGTPDAPNRVPATTLKPIQGKPVCQPATSDEFHSGSLGLQWQ